MNQDRNLLFGVLAVQLRLLTPQKLVEAAGQWAVSQERPLSEILIQLGYLSSEKVKVIDDLIGLQIKEHQGDVHATLMSLGGDRAVHESFAASLVVHQDKVELASFGGETPAEGVKAEAELEDKEHLTLEHPGRYSIKGEQGRGGIGRVLIAFDEHLGREIAVKELLPGKGAEGTPASDSPLRKTGAATARFLREARITGQLEHPGIVPVYELGKRPDSSLYYTMKLVRGKTLAEKLHECKSLRDRLQLLPHYLDLCQTMAYAHSKSVIHRDLKPQNVMVGEFGETVVLDWGLAKVKGQKDIRAEAIEKDLRLIKEAGAGETVAGKPIGTPAYMSPEQADGRIEEIDERSDVWSLGAVLYEILTGKPPFEGVNAYEVMGKVLKEPIKPALEIEKEAPADLSSVAEKCLNRDKVTRYEDAEKLSEDVQAFLSGGLVSAYHYSLGKMARRWAGKRWPVLATAATALMFLLAVGIWSYVNIRREQKEAQKNLAEAFYQFGLRAEKDRRWNDAMLYYARAVILGDKSEARSGYYLAAIQPIRVLLEKSLAGRTIETGSVAMAQNEKYLALGSCHEKKGSECLKGEIILWSVASGERWKTLLGHSNSISSLSFSPDGRLLASAGIDDKILLWSVETGQIVQTFEEPKSTFYRLSFSPDGKYILTGDVGGITKLWSVEKGEAVRTFSDPSSILGIFSVAFSPDGRFVLSGGYDSKVKLWSIATGQRLWTLEGHIYPVGSVAFSPDGKSALSGSWDKTIKWWSLETGKCLRTFSGHEDRVYSVAFSPNGEFFVSGSRDRMLKLWSLESEESLYTISGHRDYVNVVAFSTSSRQIISAGRDNTLKLWSLKKGEGYKTLTGHTSTVYSIDISPDGQYLISASEDSTLKLWSLQEGRLLRTFTGHKIAATTVSFSPDGKEVVSGGCADYQQGNCHQGELKLWSVSSGECLKTYVVHSDWVNFATFSPDGKQAVTASCAERNHENKCIKGEIKFWSLDTGECTRTFTGHENWINGVRFTPDGKYLLSFGADALLKLWSLETGKVIRDFVGHKGEVLSASISEDGKFAVSGGRDGQIRLWSLPSGECLQAVQGDDLWVMSVAFRSDGKYFVSAGWDHTVKLWSVDPLKKLLTLKGHDAGVMSVQFTPDGQSVVSGSDDKTIKIWPLQWELIAASGDELLERAQRETGLTLDNFTLVPWNPETGKVSETPLPHSF